MVLAPQIGKSECGLPSPNPGECITFLRTKISVLKERLCQIQGVVESDDLKMCVDALTGKRVLVLREDAQKKFEALFYYVQSLRAINEIEFLLDKVEDSIPHLLGNQS